MHSVICIHTKDSVGVLVVQVKEESGRSGKKDQ